MAAMDLTASGRPIHLALGGGGARGLAHIVVLEVLDALKLRPARIVGTSMGAIVGAAYAAGIDGASLRKLTLERLKNRPQVMARLLEARVGRLTDLFQRGIGNPVLVDGEKVLDLFWPESVPETFEDLAIPFAAVAADYYNRAEVLLDRGPLVSAVAASMAIPGLVRPVVIAGHVLIDGGVVNPLPFDRLADPEALVIAVDVAGGPSGSGPDLPEPFEAMLGASHLMQSTIVAEKLKVRAPDILVRPAVQGYRALDFFQARAILEAADPVREDLERQLRAALAPVSPGAPRRTT